MAGDEERGISEFAASIKDSIKDAAVDIEGIKRAGGETCIAARETTTICDSTITKARQLVEYGSEIKSALDCLSDGIDASDLTAIQRVVSRDKMRSALSLASEMDDLALACVKQSIKMIDAIDGGIDTLPDVLEKGIDKRTKKAKDKGSKEGDPELPDLEPDMRDLEQAVEAVRDVNPFTALSSFQKAFDGVITESERCKDMFSTIRSFAEDVTGVSDAIENFKIGNMVGKIRDLVKDIWRCLRLSDLIRSFAEAAGMLIKWIIKVIQAVWEKIQSIDFDYLENCNCCANLLQPLGVDTNDVKILSQKLLKALDQKTVNH